MAWAMAGVLGLAVSARADAPPRLDMSFGRTGTVATSFPQRVAHLGSLLSTSHGLVAVGSVGWPFSSTGVGLARYRRDGSLDPRFGHHGSVVVEAPGLLRPVTPAAVPDPLVNGSIDAPGEGYDGRETDHGEITVGGLVLPQIVLASEPAELVATRVTANGSLDRSYGRNGVVVQPIAPFLLAGSYTANLGVHVGHDGSILAVLWSYVLPPCVCLASGSVLTFVKLTPEGALDRSFGVAGVRTFPTPEATNWTGSAVTADGHIVVAGDNNVACLVRRFDAGGLPDPSFSTAGLDIVQTGGSGTVISTAITTTGNDTLMATSASNAVTGKSVSQVLRIDAHGQPVSTFGDGGYTATDAAAPVATLTVAGHRLITTGQVFRPGTAQVEAAGYDAASGRHLWTSAPLPGQTVLPAGAEGLRTRVMVGATENYPASAFLLYALVPH